MCNQTNKNPLFFSHANTNLIGEQTVPRRSFSVGIGPFELGRGHFDVAPSNLRSRSLLEYKWRLSILQTWFESTELIYKYIQYM